MKRVFREYFVCFPWNYLKSTFLGIQTYLSPDESQRFYTCIPVHVGISMGYSPLPDSSSVGVASVTGRAANQQLALSAHEQKQLDELITGNYNLLTQPLQQSTVGMVTAQQQPQVTIENTHIYICPKPILSYLLFIINEVDNIKC